MSLWTISGPSGFLRLTVIERLLRLAVRKYADSGGRSGEGASSNRGAAGGCHAPVELNYRQK